MVFLIFFVKFLCFVFFIHKVVCFIFLANIGVSFLAVYIPVLNTTYRKPGAKSARNWPNGVILETYVFDNSILADYHY